MQEATPMPYARKSMISLKDTPYYHCVSRCVRKSWLWGRDEYSNKDFSHRKVWMEDRLRQLSAVFSIDLCAYAVMSNHYHLVLHVDKRRAVEWSSKDVVHRWSQLFRLPLIVQRWQQGLASIVETTVALELVKRWRARLMDISWYMRCLNEHLARLANREDDCTGRFWEGRFKSQALLDEAGLLTAMAYVDLNPVRAGAASTPETSDFTSIFARVKAVARGAKEETVARMGLMAFKDEAAPGQSSIPFSRNDYLALLDWTGRRIIAGKAGAISEASPPIVQRLNIDADVWATSMRPRGNVFGRALGCVDRMRLHAQTLGQSWIRGLRRAEQLYRFRSGQPATV
jgi:REP element-mobilizing transposase RayT